MIDAKQIPDEAARALINAITMLHKSPHESLAAALNAWDGATVVKTRYAVHVGPFDPYIILPLPKEGE